MANRLLGYTSLLRSLRDRTLQRAYRRSATSGYFLASLRDASERVTGSGARMSAGDYIRPRSPHPALSLGERELLGAWLRFIAARTSKEPVVAISRGINAQIVDLEVNHETLLF
jgi:hypothetical protein